MGDIHKIWKNNDILLSFVALFRTLPAFLRALHYGNRKFLFLPHFPASGIDKPHFLCYIFTRMAVMKTRTSDKHPREGSIRCKEPVVLRM